MIIPEQPSSRLDVGVMAMFTSDGIKPRAIIMPDGVKYGITRVTDVRMAPSAACGGFGTRHTCRVEDKLLHLYRDAAYDNMWYIDLSTVEDV